MEENEFEKKMQQKMELLQMQPDEGLWQKIQVQVEKKTAHKRKYIIFSFLLLCFVACSLLVADLKQYPSSLNKKAENKNEKNVPQINTENNKQQKQLLLNDKQNITELPLMLDDVCNKNQRPNPLSSISRKNNNHKISRMTNRILKSKISLEKLSEEAVTENTIAEKIYPSGTVAAGAEKLQYDKKTIAPVDTVAKESLQKELLTENKDANKIQQQVSPKNKKQLWQTSFSFAAGRSSTGNKYLNNQNFAAYSDAIGATPNIGDSSVIVNLPSAAKPGLLITAGFEVHRSLSVKTTLGAGLQYQLHTSSITTGEKAAAQSTPGSRVKAAYKTGNSNKYTTAYHFISLPLSISTQIAVIKDKQINLNTALVFSRLIHTNALQFDYAQRSYFNDNSLFNKTTAGLSAAAFINIAGKNKAAFNIGPEFYYSLTPMASSGIYTASHYKSFGIRMQKMLQKK